MRLIVFMWLVQSVYTLDVGEVGCKDNFNQTGVCKSIAKCNGAIRALENKIKLSICANRRSVRSVPVVCCVEEKATSTMLPMTSTRPSTITTEYTPTEPDNGDFDITENECPPIHNITVHSTDRVAWKKCLQYQDDLVYPCKFGPLGNRVRGKNCKHKVNELIYGGVNAGIKEFPHMVMLSYELEVESFQSGCGGSLISDWFILTAAHCTYKRNAGEVKYAATGVLKQTDISSSRIYKIAQRLQHEEYVSKRPYYDIALLKTETKILLDSYAIPACLDIGDDLDSSKALVTGWGEFLFGEPTSKHLQKAVLDQFTEQECSQTFVGETKLPNGVNFSIQTCYGSKQESKDTCKGDSGGPLQLKMQRVQCMYSIIGVISFGIGCGTIGKPALYTRVMPFVSWIEKVVWPDE